MSSLAASMDTRAPEGEEGRREGRWEDIIPTGEEAWGWWGGEYCEYFEGFA